MSGQKLGHIPAKPFVCSRGHIFSLIIMKLGQNVCLDEILNKFENGSCWVRNQVTSLGQMLKKPCVCSKGHIFSQIIMKVGQNVRLDEILDKFKNGSCQVKS